MKKKWSKDALLNSTADVGGQIINISTSSQWLITPNLITVTSAVVNSMWASKPGSLIYSIKLFIIGQHSSRK